MRDLYGRGVMAEGASGLDQTIARASVRSADSLKRWVPPRTQLQMPKHMPFSEVQGCSVREASP